MIFGMEEKLTLLSLISLTLSFFKFEYQLYLIIYPYKLPGLTLYLNFLIYRCDSAHKNGVKEAYNEYQKILVQYLYRYDELNTQK